LSCDFGKRARSRPHESGFLLLSLVASIAVLSALFLASLEVAWSAQRRVALQSRLDVCAVKLALARERLLERLTETNAPLEATVLGIYAARAVSAVPIVGAISAADAQALVVANQLLAAGQDAIVLAGAAREAAGLVCQPDAYSREPAWCLVTPPPPGAFARRTTLFPDVKGTLAHRSGEEAVAKVRCRGGRGAGMETELAVRGDAGLREKGFRDVYQR
jgi:hypothetical protein